ncbi:MAG: hypothetical protein ACFB16_08690 [Phormidesmis sp.]
MDASLIRLAWSVVDQTPIPRQQNLTSRDRIGAVLSAIDQQAVLSPQERQQIHQYLLARQHLLTDLYQ